MGPLILLQLVPKYSLGSPLFLDPPFPYNIKQKRKGDERKEKKKQKEKKEDITKCMKRFVMGGGGVGDEIGDGALGFVGESEGVEGEGV